MALRKNLLGNGSKERLWQMMIRIQTIIRAIVRTAVPMIRQHRTNKTTPLQARRVRRLGLIPKRTIAKATQRRIAKRVIANRRGKASRWCPGAEGLEGLGDKTQD